MPFCLVLAGCLARPASPSITELDKLAQAKNSAALARYLANPPSRNPFAIIKSGGAYGVGRFGWHALALKEPEGGRQFVVFSTPLTSEDTGELVFERVGGKLAYIPEDNDLGARPVDHRLDVVFHPSEKQAVITDEFTLEREKAGLTFLRMGPQYRVSSIGGHRFAQSGGVVALDLPSGKATLTIRYHAVVNLPRFAGSISANEATLTNDYWYPMISRLPAPYSSTIHAPKGWTGVAQGELTAHKERTNESVWSYRMNLPVVYFSLSAAPYQVLRRSVNGKIYSVWSASMSKEDMIRQTELYPPIIEFYSKNFAPIPFSGYGAVVSDSYGGGALEAYSFATYGTGWLPAEDGHEPSHTWWGGIIPNTYLHSFWNESFADFSDSMYQRNVPIGNIDERRLAFVNHPKVNGQFNVAPIAHAGVDIGPAADTLGYGKGAWVLTTLEDLIGTPTMITSMHRWIADSKRGIPGEWPGFEKAVAETTGQDLSWFWNQWLERSGYPRFGLSDVTADDHAVSMTLKFDGTPYRLDAEVLVGYGDHEEIAKIQVPAEPTCHLSIPVKSRPLFVSFDPYRRLIREIPIDENPPSVASAFQRSVKYGAGSGDAGALSKGEMKDVSSIPQDLNGCTLVGQPAQWPLIGELAAKAGFSVDGWNLTYDGTVIDLHHDGAWAIVDLGQGKSCVIAMGRPDLFPNTGDAHLALFDHLGRFLRGKTDPKRAGSLVFRF